MKGSVRRYIIILLPIVFVGSLLFPTWRVSVLEKERAAVDTTIDKNALAEWDAKNMESLKNNRAQALKLGLDLSGGMYVTLEVDAVRLLEEAADRSAKDDEVFKQVIAKTHQISESSDEPVIEIFKKNFNEIARPMGKSLINYYDLADMKEISEEKILEKLTRDVDEAIDQALQVIRQRVDKFGVAEPTIQKQGTRRILLELPGVQDEGQMRQLLQTTARLDFKLVRGGGDVLRAFLNIDEYLERVSARKKGAVVAADTVAAPADSTKSAAVASTDSTKKDSAAVASKDSGKTKDPYAGLSDEQKREKYLREHPFTSLFRSQFAMDKKQRPQDFAFLKEQIATLPPAAEYYYTTDEKSKAAILNYMKRDDIRRLLPADLEVVVDAKPLRGTEKTGAPLFSMYVVKRDAELTGEVIVDAFENFDPTSNRPIVDMMMNDEGSEKWARITGANVGKRIAIVLDGEVYSAPNVQNKITGGRSQITGMANIEEAKLLKIILKAGALKAPVKIIEERLVGPSLGEDSIKYGMLSGIIAFVLVVLFMTVFYSTAGIVANLAMLINVALNIAALAAFGGTLSLPGIAGIILTIGLAVDANIIIFERIREEIYRGLTLRDSIDEGFHHALPPIIDSHVTTLITALILMYFGYGAIQGFAVTLIIGIFSTLFTGIIVSRSIIELVVNRKPGATINFGQHASLNL
ncbi:MAG: protein translocase subunit SecD [Candidatus Kapaibacterium sp.]